MIGILLAIIRQKKYIYISFVSTIHNSIGNVILAQFIYDTKINEHYFSILKSALLIVQQYLAHKHTEGRRVGYTWHNSVFYVYLGPSLATCKITMLSTKVSCKTGVLSAEYCKFCKVQYKPLYIEKLPRTWIFVSPQCVIRVLL